MRAATAALAVFALVAIIAYCPAWVCAPAVAYASSHSCCHGSKHTHEQPPCDATSQTCPYLLLEKGKAIVLHFAPPPLILVTIAPPAKRNEGATPTPVYLPNAADLYLRNRVLLI
jgi:hypothetical protein